jgi:hypothetical protein
MANLSPPDDAEGAGGHSTIQPDSTAEKRCSEDGDALGECALRLNPEAMRGVPPLPGLDDVETVLVVQPAHAWARWTEGLAIHVIGSGFVAAVAFCVGLLLGSPSTGAGGSVGPQPSKSCVVAPVPHIKDRNG